MVINGVCPGWLSTYSFAILSALASFRGIVFTTALLAVRGLLSPHADMGIINQVERGIDLCPHLFTSSSLQVVPVHVREMNKLVVRGTGETQLQRNFRRWSDCRPPCCDSRLPPHGCCKSARKPASLFPLQTIQGVYRFLHAS